ncbi:ABC transporter ATP-binding protein [Arthrobacter sp. Leaf141]|uniref:ABC transporter ATP-binding protein n=1 Tax=Arthrobacter sp. Leaf141 TaxID=1736273 RepID=UPI0009E814E5|nr:oligopeptide/dipeptide ABC transporter ATP-binding protein [Arthrobacter sp. Leaf141]
MRTDTPAAPFLDVLTVQDLAVEFPVRGPLFSRTTLKAVNGVSLHVAPGETLGLVGESGCGKSTLVRAILGLNKPSSGAVAVGGRNLAGLLNGRRRQERARIQMVFQDPYSSLDPRLTVHEIIAEPLRINGQYTAAAVTALLEQVGLTAAMGQRKPGEFSGGQRQRVGIARALALKPELLILDEPVSALDVSVQAQVINLLQDLQAELGLAYLFIAHDLSVVRQISHRVAVMYMGRIVETGPAADVFTNPQHPYTKALMSAAPVADPDKAASRQRVVLTGDLPDAANLPSGCAFRTRCPQAEASCAAVVPSLLPPVPTQVDFPVVSAHQSACLLVHP